MNIKKIKEILKTKKAITIMSIVLGATIVGVGSMIVYNESQVEERNVATVTNKKEDNKEDAKDKEENLKDKETAKNDKEEETSSDKKEDSKNDVAVENKEENKESTSDKQTMSSKTSNKEENKTSAPSQPNNPSVPEKPYTPPASKPNLPAHSHDWQAVTETVNHPEQGHYETVTIKEGWVEEKPVYEMQARDICNTCNADITGTNIPSHVREHMLAGNDKGGHRTEWQQVKVGTEKITHPPVTEQRWIVDKGAWTETITKGYKCSCGATK